MELRQALVDEQFEKWELKISKALFIFTYLIQ